MIPILFEESSTSYNTQGIGALIDATKCNVTEERNGAFELYMEYPQIGSYFIELKLGRIILAQPSINKDAEPFRIYQITKPLNGIVKVYAEHISYQLTMIPLMPYTAESVTDAIAKISQYASEELPFTFWTDKTTVANFNISKPSSIRSALGGIEGSILDTYGGEYEWKGFDVKLHNNRGTDRGVSIRYGKNLTDINQEENIASTVTGVCPYYKNDDVLVTLPEKVIHSEYADRYPYKRTITKDFSGDFENAPTVEQLRTKAQAYINQSGIGLPKVSIDVSFVQLSQFEEYKDMSIIEQVNLCDIVNVVFEDLGIETSAKVVKTDYDVLMEKYERITIGTIRATLTSQMQEYTEENEKALETAKTSLETAIDNATERITGVSGGYVVLNQDASGKPFEILIMDTDDKDTAQKVWRWNKEGLGYSSTGYSGQYGLAMTSDGKIVADYITTGTIDASLIKAGTLSDANGKYNLNMTNGTVNMANANITGGSINIQTESRTSDKIKLTYGNYTMFLTPSGLTLESSLGKTMIDASSVGIYKKIDGSNILTSYLYKDGLQMLNDDGTANTVYTKTSKKFSLFKNVTGTTSIDLSTMQPYATEMLVMVKYMDTYNRIFQGIIPIDQLEATKNQVFYLGGYYLSETDNGYASVNISKSSASLRYLKYNGTEHTANARLYIYWR